VILHSTGVLENSARVYKLSNGKKIVAFIPMHHIGKQEFYNDVAKKVDSFRKQNYEILYESLGIEKGTDSLTRDLSKRKIRKILGFLPTGYYNTETKTIMGKYKYRGKHELVNQPKYKYLNIDSSIAIKADVPLNILISEYEKHHGEITLSNCDYATDLKTKEYTCEKFEKTRRNKYYQSYVHDYRNKVLAQFVLNSKKDNITIVYGENHFEPLLIELKKTNPNWVKVK
jgi:hypothetical protein